MLTDLLDAFKAVGLFDHLSDSASYILEKKVIAYQSQAIIDILGMAGDIIIDVRDKNAERPEDYVEFFNEMRTLSRGEFDFTDFAIEWADRDKGELLVTFSFGGRCYETSIRIFPLKFFNTDSPVRSANRAMAEAGIDSRFHNISTLNEGGGLEPGAVIFLSPKKRKMLLEQKLLLMPWARDEANIGTADRVVKLIDDLREIGLLSHLDEEHIKAVQEQIKPEYVTDLVDMLYMFPVVSYSFDIEFIYDSSKIVESYIELFTNISQISHGAFAPENITVTLGPEIAENEWQFIILSFECENRSYSRKLEFIGDWVDVGFVTTMNEALTDAGQAGRFYDVDTGDQAALIIFLTEEQRKAIEEKNLFSLREFK